MTTNQWVFLALAIVVSFLGRFFLVERHKHNTALYLPRRPGKQKLRGVFAGPVPKGDVDAHELIARDPAWYLPSQPLKDPRQRR